MNEGRDHPNSLEVRKFQPSRRRLKRDLPHFADGERVAMTERLQEFQAGRAPPRRAGEVDGQRTVLTKIAALPQAGCAIAKRLHALFELMRQPCRREPITVPAYAKNGNVV